MWFFVELVVFWRACGFLGELVVFAVFVVFDVFVVFVELVVFWASLWISVPRS
jgi:hypothetical protein